MVKLIWLYLAKVNGFSNRGRRVVFFTILLQT